MRVSTALVALAAAAVSAQTNYTSELDMKIDPNSVAPEKRAEWCRGQINTCNILCSDETKDNGCFQETLTYKCTCAANNSMPGLEFYQQTLPTFICETNFAQCISRNAGSQDAQAACKANIQSLCGKLPPPKKVSSSGDGSAESASSPSDSTKPTSSATGGATAATTTSSRGLAAPTVAPGANGAAAAAVVGFLAYFL